MKRTIAVLGIVAVLAVGLVLVIVHESSNTPTGPTIVAVYPNVEWYPPCAISPITVGGHVLYPIPMGDPTPDANRYPSAPITSSASVVSWDSVGSAGHNLPASLPKVVAPGPGDDIGTVTLYSDGFAKFVSHSGNVAWLTSVAQTYGYVC